MPRRSTKPAPRGGGFLLYQLSVEDLTVDIIKDDGQNVPLLAAESDGSDGQGFRNIDSSQTAGP